MPEETTIVEALVSLREEGLVVCNDDVDTGDPAWRIASAPSVESAPASKATSPPVALRQRLRPSELRARVSEYVRERPHEELSPTAVARALGASAGAVNNAMERLVETGDVVRTADSPRRFSATQKRR